MTDTPHSDAAIAKLRDATRKPAAHVSKMVSLYSTALTHEREQTAIEMEHRAVAQLILAIETCKSAFGAMLDVLKPALASSMEDTGETKFWTQSHVVYVSDKGPHPIVISPSEVPASMMTTPDPRPDLAKIKEAMKHGPVPGCAMSNGGVTLNFRSK